MERLLQELLREWIPQQQQRMEELVVRWADQNSGGDNASGQRRLQEMLAHDFLPLKGRRSALPLGAAEHLCRGGQWQPRQYGPLLLIENYPKAAVRLLLGGHYDTVFGSHSPFQRCRRDGERLYGPGVCDMKGGLAVMLVALEALERSPLRGRLGWDVLISPDEEDGSPASASVWRKHAWKNQYALIFEPPLSEGCLVSSRKGSLNVALTATGERAHAGRDFHKGVNAIGAMSALLADLHALNDPALSTTFNIGIVGGGDGANIVAPHCHAVVNIRSPDDVQLAAAENKLGELLGRQRERHPRVEWQCRTLSRRPAKQWRSFDEAFFQKLQRCAAEFDIQLTSAATGGVCDGNLVAVEGIPTLDTLGAVGGAIHTEGEWLSLPSLSQRAQIVAALLFKLAKDQPDQAP